MSFSVLGLFESSCFYAWDCVCCEGEDHVVELNLVGKLHINARSHASGGNQLQCPMFTENVPVSSHVLEDTAYRSYVLLVILGKEKGRACKWRGNCHFQQDSRWRALSIWNCLSWIWLSIWGRTSEVLYWDLFVAWCGWYCFWLQTNWPVLAYCYAVQLKLP